MATNPLTTDWGLSPRARGNRTQIPDIAIQRRSIPACTGEPIPTASIPVLPWVYPRVHGGTRKAIRVTASCAGLSPRARGNPLQNL